MEVGVCRCCHCRRCRQVQVGIRLVVWEREREGREREREREREYLKWKIKWRVSEIREREILGENFGWSKDKRKGILVNSSLKVTNIIKNKFVAKNNKSINFLIISCNFPNRSFTKRTNSDKTVKKKNDKGSCEKLRANGKMQTKNSGKNFFLLFAYAKINYFLL